MFTISSEFSIVSLVDLSQSKTRWPVWTLVKRGLWTFFLEPAVRWWPKSFSPLRVAALRLMGAKIAPRCLILPGVKVLMPWNLVMQDHVAIGRHVDVYNFAPVTIKRQTVISQDVYLCTGSHDFRASSMPLTYRPITIGSECWLAAGVFVCPGVDIADGVVVGARSVVTKSIQEPWSVHGGNPSVRMKTRQMNQTN
jgi:putative colanic acid biosynthesis acetyltransferase WcaF